jgi:hypothetical protein
MMSFSSFSAASLGHRKGKKERTYKRQTKKQKEKQKKLLEILVLDELNNDVFFRLNLKHL